MLYRYCMAQTFAIAQSTALQFGDLHCAAILTRGDDCFRDQLGRTRYKLYTWGRGFHGELGKQKPHDEDEAVTRPRSVCLGYSAYNVSIQLYTASKITMHRSVRMHNIQGLACVCTFIQAAS